jgi:hypothetical protein
MRGDLDAADVEKTINTLIGPRTLERPLCQVKLVRTVDVFEHERPVHSEQARLQQELDADCE